MTSKELMVVSHEFKRLLESGKSIAVALGWSVGPSDVASARYMACQDMTWDERNAWEAFQKRDILPAIDWKNAVKSKPGSSIVSKKISRKLAALQDVYQDDSIKLENYYWFVEHFADFSPLLRAQQKITKYTSACFPQNNGLTGTENAEYNAIVGYRRAIRARRHALYIEEKAMKSTWRYRLAPYSGIVRRPDSP